VKKALPAAEPFRTHERCPCGAIILGAADPSYFEVEKPEQEA
jgi:hypothetical protein